MGSFGIIRVHFSPTKSVRVLLAEFRTAIDGEVEKWKSRVKDY